MQPISRAARACGLFCCLWTLALLCLLFSERVTPGCAAEPKSSAAKDPPAGNAAQPVDPEHAAKMERSLALFKTSVRQTLRQHCLKCHGGERIESGFDLSDRESLLKGGTAGKALEIGKSKSSRLLRRLNHAENPGMPFQQEKLPEAKIAEISMWIDLGAAYDQPLVEKKAKVANWTEKVVDPESKQFWSFQPLRHSAAPAVTNEAWCRTPIDRFILAKLEARSVAPNPEASRLQLLRRAHFDLLGLPPAPDEIDRYPGDTSAEAWEHLLDRLLDSPHYGERWGRHWLDVARFAESHGFEHDTDRPTAYHYRDFVIEALNRDLPFDTFVQWQIAGDELAPADILALRGTGFLAAGVHSTQITKNEVEKHRYDELDDMLGTISQSMLGLSIQCARCHDHKFDPIPQRDYYRLLATFTTTVRSEVDLDFDPEGYRRARQAFDTAHEPLVEKRVRYENEQLPARLSAWEKESPDLLARFPWVVLDCVSQKSTGGANLTRQPDGSFVASGNNPDQETYTFVVSTTQTGITGFRVEALGDPKLPKGGPGRAPNGNFLLTDFQVTIAPLTPKASGEPDPPQPPAATEPVLLRLKNPRATFEQSGLPIAAAIDGDEKTGWAIDPQFGKDHAAAFALETPTGFANGSVLTFTLKFQGNSKHSFGRPRLSLSSAKDAVPLDAPAVPQAIVQGLRVAPAERTAEQKAQLLEWYAGALDPEWKTLQQNVLEHLAHAPQPTLRKAMISSEGLPAIRLNTQGGDFLEQTHFLRRGDPDQKEAIATPGFLQVLMRGDDDAHWREAPPEGWRTSYRRRALANWLTDVDHGAGALLARVAVNRLWQHHFGRGLVATPSDFGVRGAPPSHPELLDWLAGELIARGWSLKALHKLIMQSAVYRQSSLFDEQKAGIDRENELCWRRTPHRLEAEVIRDNLLAVSGTLDPALYGPGTLDETSRRRSIYFTVKRSKLVPMMQVFDAPDALSSIGDRPSTTIAPQALLLMNNPQTRALARAFAVRIDRGADLSASVKAAYRTAMARPPTDVELADGLAFIEAQAASYTRDDRTQPQLLALADFCQVLMCLNEFVYVD